MAAKSSDNPQKRAAQSMEELLSRTGYIPKGLIRGQKVEGTIVEVGGKSLVLDIGAKSEGLVVDREFEDVRAFIKTLSPGDKIEAVVIVPETENGQSLLSIRETAEESAWSFLQEALKEEREIEVRVEDVTRGGLTVDILGITGFVPSSHLGAALSKTSQAAIGRLVKVKIIEIDKTKGRLVLSEKAVSEAEVLQKAAEIIKKIKKGEKFIGRVVALVSFGAFVQVEVKGVPIDGLVHLSELSWQKVQDPSEVVKEGDSVEVLVIGKEELRLKSARLAFSIKQAQPDPWEEVAQKYKPDAQLRGRVTRVGELGVFVELEPGVEGLIPLSKVPATVSIKENDSIDCFVDEVNPKAHRISLRVVLKEKPIGYK